MSTSWPVGLRTWAAALQQASFRGVPFFVESHEAGLGRRVVVHEYPFQDLPETEDLGARAGEYRISAYVLPGRGAGDYFAARDRLYDALNQPGAGALVHPYLGTVQVVILHVRLTETTREGGVARFEIHCIAASAVTRPTATPDTRAAVAATAETAQAAANAQFTGGWNYDAVLSGQAMFDALDDAFAPLERAVGVAEDASTLAKQLVAMPDRIAARLDADFRELGSLASLKKFFAWAPAPSTAHPSRADAASIAALTQHVQLTAAVAAAQLSAQLDYRSYDEAIAARDLVLDQLDAVAANADADTFDALQELRAQVARDIATRAADLRRITSYTPAETAPALMIAEQLYGPDGIEEQAADVLARNAIVHPLFVPGGVQLEVLTDG
ncbi:MAG: DNA circularization N-terminal domain-containing protein [Sinobacteraceae bacterium]|nr:DNA circularization N-terminal domain-containing protein [Nevskiaceae bacterium]